ncbi:prephenate dehydratase [Mycobacterium antarcticum]|uniref:prephenate dehydratase n=1 Tax=unclassified Mycolicibacterium TaxID=2636767 RepID=UPI0023877A03|nr:MULTISPECIES: prephenate dehydratase [unclassified Mycolicibacterium]BDX29748.1 prephenate dehydratase [Mycolicibacterium sp. TUM20985]GLP78889.1 prephenate dehydratase [Mycolicibacterium sp. TUM20984]
MSRVAYLGPEGTFTEAALLQMAAAELIPGSGASEFTPLPCDSADGALAAVRAGAADYACAPIENSIDGSVVPTMDSLAMGAPLQIFAEHTLDVAFSIVVRAGLPASDVRTVAAYPVAAAQVKRWLGEHLPAARMVPATSNAAAAHDVAEGRADAGVSTALAAERLGLASLADGVVDEANARTRFILVGRPAPPPARTGTDRTSIVLRLDNVPGALVAAMAEFAIRDIDLTRIESRPTRVEMGTYVFFLDCVGHIEDEPVAEALRALHRRCTDVRYLGSWSTGAADGAPLGAAPPVTDEAAEWLAGLREGRAR